MHLVDRNKEHFLFMQEVDPAVMQASWFATAIGNNNTNGGSSVSVTNSFLYAQPTGPGALMRQRSVAADKTMKSSYNAGKDNQRKVELLLLLVVVVVVMIMIL